MTQPETVEAMRADAGQIIEPDAFAAYLRKVKAKSPHYDTNPAAALAHFGFDQWQRAKRANRRADEAERERREAVECGTVMDECQKSMFVKMKAAQSELASLRESLAKAEGALNAVDQERDGFAQLCSLRLSERDDAREQAASFQAMYRQACDWRDAKIAAAEARALKAESQVAEAKAALRWYAGDGSTYDGIDVGQRARSTLASLEPKETDADV